MIPVTLQLPSGRELRAGTITLQQGRGRHAATPVFEYDSSYIADPESYELSGDLPLGPGPIWPRDGKDMFAGFQDALPDSWAKRLLQDAHRRAAAARSERPSPATELDLLLMVGDAHRQGALRFWSKDTPLADSGPSATPLELRTLADAADKWSAGEATDDELRRLLAAGSTPGGYRPKANVVNDSGTLLLAKFPLHTDPYDVSAWEQAAMSMQAEAGISVVPSRLLRLGPSRHTFITERFDRCAGRRIHYRSVAAIFGTAVGERLPYSTMAQRLARGAADPRALQRELFRRAAFNTLVSCTDDHMRNHGVLREPSGWALSPAFDVNPHRDFADATPLTETDDPGDRDIRLLLAARDDFAMTEAEAVAVIQRCARATDGWRDAAVSSGVRSDAVTYMARAFEHENRSRAHTLSPATATTVDLAAGAQPRRPAGSPRSSGGQFARKQPPGSSSAL